MTFYAETSALLTWLLDQQGADEIRRLVQGAQRVVVSELTMVEARRVLARLRADGVSTVILERTFNQASAAWTRIPMTEEILIRAGEPFPVEPVRTLDAIHLATVELHIGLFGPLTVLALDKRVRENAAAMGWPVAP